MEPTFTNVAILVGVFIFGYMFNDLVAYLWDSKPMTKEEYDNERALREEASLGYVHKAEKDE